MEIFLSVTMLVAMTIAVVLAGFVGLLGLAHLILGWRR